jgi:hypothetical protein
MSLRPLGAKIKRLAYDLPWHGDSVPEHEAAREAEAETS